MNIDQPSPAGAMLQDIAPQGIKPTGSPRPPFRRRVVIVSLLVGALSLLLLYQCTHKKAKPEPPAAQPVRVAGVTLGDVPIYFQGLGTVTPANTVLVKSRVDGELMALHFVEGQEVRAGDLLAEIDPRPFEVQLKQAEGALARDTAQLKDARLDLARFRKLVKEESVSAQQVQSQEALVGQLEGAVHIDEAGIADAKLQLTYCRITAPVTGRLGLKQMDTGNIVHASDANGIVVITQMQPMYVVFTLVEKQLPAVLEAMREGPRTVEAWDQSGKTLAAVGTLLTLDNQIDTSTGTVKAKAAFDNADGRLFPNQFVTTKLLVKTLKQAAIIPTPAVQRNSDGFFVYVVRDGAVSMRPFIAGHATSDVTVVEKGLEPGEVVVTDGVDKLREGTKVRFEGQSPLSQNATGQGAGKQSKNGPEHKTTK